MGSPRAGTGVPQKRPQVSKLEGNLGGSPRGQNRKPQISKLKGTPKSKILLPLAVFLETLNNFDGLIRSRRFAQVRKGPGKLETLLCCQPSTVNPYVAADGRQLEDCPLEKAPSTSIPGNKGRIAGV